MKFKVKLPSGRYRSATREEILNVASGYQIADVEVGTPLGGPRDADKLVRSLVGGYESERFGVVFLDTRHRLIAAERMFQGTIDGATIYVREIAKRALELNASAIVLCHNHPSGVAQPSEADLAVTKRIQKALELFEIRLLDHLIVGGRDCVSMAERGWI